MKQGASILVADDDRDVCNILGMFLKRQGHTVSEAYDGNQAWDKIRKEKPDLVLLDIMMPGMSGLEVCRKIREAPSVSKTPVIMISALTERNEILEGFKTGATDYITKPFVNAEVLARVRAALRHWRLMTQQRRGQELRGFGDELDRIINELDKPLVHLMRNTKRLRDITVAMDVTEKKLGQLLYQHGMRTYLIVRELQNKKSEIRERMTGKKPEPPASQPGSGPVRAEAE
jgi:DNA-binding response OmpR family regulator